MPGLSPFQRDSAWREIIVTWTLRLLGCIGIVWIAVAMVTTRWFLVSPYGIGFSLTVLWVWSGMLFPRLPMAWRLGGVVAYLAYNVTVGLMVAGPNPGNTSLVLMAVLFGTLFSGLRFGLLIMAISLLEVTASAIGWRHHLFPLGGVAPNIDPRLMATWVRAAMAIADGSVAIAIVVGIVVQQLSHAADDAAAALQREMESALRYRELFERLPLGVYRTTADGRVLAANPAMIAMLGYSRIEEVLALNLEADLYPPEYSRSQFKARLEREAEIRGAEAIWRRRDGSTIFIRENARVVRDATGGVLYYEGTVEDFTERKAMEERLRHAQRLEAIGTLASGVAHDLNNILTPVLMASELIEHKLPPADQELAVLIKNGARRGTDIIRRLLVFGRNPTRGPLAGQPAQVLSDIASLMRATFPRSIEIAEEFPPVLPAVAMEVSQLHQVVMNLCVNARDAMAGGGRLSLGASEGRVDAGAASRYEGVSPGPFVVISVRDTGHGIPPEILERIFDPFFTTKEVGRGTGLGLWSAYSILKSHGGFITVESAKGNGTVFRIFLPVADSAPVSALRAPVGDDRRGQGQGETILVVDDEPAILTATRRVLEAAGFHVLTANGGADALRIVSANPSSVRLVISDLMMPGMDGLALAGRLRELLPRVKFIGVSGLEQAGRSGANAAPGFCEMLAKPYEPDALKAAVRRALG